MNECRDIEAVDHDFSSVLARCERLKYSHAALEELRNSQNRWVFHVEFRKGDTALRVHVLNWLASMLTIPEIRNVTWAIIVRLAEIGYEQTMPHLRESLTIAVFELAAEPPEVPWFCELLFTLGESRNTKWALFEAYRRWPRRFKEHINRYGRGCISQKEYEDWLSWQGLRHTSCGLRFRKKIGRSSATCDEGSS